MYILYVHIILVHINESLGSRCSVPICILVSTNVPFCDAPNVLVIVSPAADGARLLPFTLLTLPITPHFFHSFSLQLMPPNLPEERLAFSFVLQGVADLQTRLQLLMTEQQLIVVVIVICPTSLSSLSSFNRLVPSTFTCRALDLSRNLRISHAHSHNPCFTRPIITSDIA